MKFVELKTHLTAKTPKPCYILQGEDRYLVLWSRKLISSLIELSEFNIRCFNEQASIKDLIASLETMPVASPFSLTVLEEVKSIAPELTTYLKDPNPASILLIIPKAGNPIIKPPTNSEIVDCSYLDMNVVQSFIKKEASDGITKEAGELLGEYCMNDMMRISTELEKLKLYCLNRRIERADVEAMVNRDTDYKIYQFLEKLALKRGDEALNIISAMGVEAVPLKIIASIGSHFRKLFHLKISSMSDESIANAFGVKTYALKYLKSQASMYTALKLKEINDYIFDADYRIKTGKIKDSFAMYNIIQKILCA